MGQNKLRGRSVPFRQQLQALSQQLQNLLDQHNSLATTNSALLLKQNLLQGLAEGMQAFQVSRAVVDPDGLIDGLCQPVFSEGQLQMLVQQEVALMQQLTSGPEDPSHTSSTTTSSGSQQDSVLDFGIETIAPPEDRMAAFRTHVQAPPLPQAASMTPRELAQQLRDWMQQFSMQLIKLQGGQSAAAVDALKDTMNKLMHMLVSLIVLGRQDVTAHIQSFHLETMQSDPEHLQAATENTLQVAPDLGLTDQQAHAIATGVELYLELQQATQREQRVLQDALATLDKTDGAAVAACASSTAGLDSRAERLEQQQWHMQRLQSLLQKEYILQFTMCGWLSGCLSYEQLARAYVLVFPYVMRLTHLGLGIQQWYRSNPPKSEGRQDRSSSLSPSHIL